MSRRAIWPRVFPYTGALFASRARPPFRTETADDLDDRPACRANPTGLVPRTIRRLVEGLAAIRICCASRGNCCRRDSPKDAAVLAAYCAGYLRSRRDAENDHLSVPVNGRPARNGLEEPGGREDARAFEVSPADAETRYSAPQTAARAPLRRPRRNAKWGRKRKACGSLICCSIQVSGYNSRAGQGDWLTLTCDVRRPPHARNRTCRIDRRLPGCSPAHRDCPYRRARSRDCRGCER